MFRPRTTVDDERSIRRMKLKSKAGDIPLPTKIPIVSWNRPLEAQEGNFCAGGEHDVLKCSSWPLSTTILCHHCCYSFDGVPVPLPQSYDALRKVYHCRGNFCSWQCAKAYNIRQTPLAGRGNRNMYIAILAHRTWVKYRTGERTPQEEKSMKTYAMYCIHPSPPRENLQVFGGDMTIADFRKELFGIIPPSEAVAGKPFLTLRQKLCLPFVQLNEKDDDDAPKSVKPATQKIDTSSLHQYSNAFCAKLNKAKNDESIMKRKRKINSANTLMSTMGVVIETKKSRK